jgi:hypothetical protein
MTVSGASPLRLTESQMFEVMTAANQIPQEVRGIYLQQVAAELQAKKDFGDADVHRAAHKVARAFQAAPPGTVGSRHEDIRGWTAS